MSDVRPLAVEPGPTRGRRYLLRQERVLLLALGCYAGVTLLVPLLRGAGNNPEY